MDLRIPNLRSGSYYPSFLEPRRITEHTLVAVVQEAYLNGVSTPKFDDLVRSLGMSGIATSQVSRLCSKLDEWVEAFRSLHAAQPMPSRTFAASQVRHRQVLPGRKRSKVTSPRKQHDIASSMFGVHITNPSSREGAFSGGYGSRE